MDKSCLGTQKAQLENRTEQSQKAMVLSYYSSSYLYLFFNQYNTFAYQTFKKSYLFQIFQCGYFQIDIRRLISLGCGSKYFMDNHFEVSSDSDQKDTSYRDEYSNRLLEEYNNKKKLKNNKFKREQTSQDISESVNLLTKTLTKKVFDEKRAKIRQKPPPQPEQFIEEIQYINFAPFLQQLTNLLKNKPAKNENIYKEWFFKMSICRNKTNLQIISLCEGCCKVSKTFPKDENHMSKYADQKMQQIYNKKYFLAKSFLTLSYGYINFKKANKSTLISSRNDYIYIAAAVSRKTFRQLEKFLLKQCKIPIKRINHKQINMLRKLILKSKENLRQSQVMDKFITLTFRLQAVAVSGQQAIRLYKELQESLKLTINSMVMHPSLQQDPNSSFQNIWRNHRESQLLQLYLKDPQKMTSLIEYLIKMHPPYQKVIQIGRIHKKIYQIILKYLQMLKKQFDGLTLIKIINHYIENEKDYLIRKKLIIFYLSSGSRNVSQLKKLMKECIILKDSAFQKREKSVIKKLAQITGSHQNQFQQEYLFDQSNQDSLNFSYTQD